MGWQDQLIHLGQVALAAILGGLIGVEREWKGKAAGVRTHMFVAGASALLVLLSLHLARFFEAETWGKMVHTDPTRVVQAIVTGISFIGAGTVIFHRDEHRLEGLTTAASILLTASIGIAVALELHVLAAGVVVLTLTALVTIAFLNRQIAKKSDQHD